MKHNRLISLVEEMPNHNIESATWLLLIFLLQIYSESKLMGQKNTYIMYSSERKKYKHNVQFVGENTYIIYSLEKKIHI